MKIQISNRQWAFTMTEGLMVMATLALLFAMFLPELARMHRHSDRFGCVNHLQQTGIAFRIWEGDNNDSYPMNVSMTNGGAEELIATGNVAACFQVMSNELATPKILVCPDDSAHDYATNFDTAFSRANISYFIGVKAMESNPQEILSGDANLVLNGRPVAAGVVDLGTNTATWTSDRHEGSGNVLITDGSVQTEREISCSAASDGYFVTNSMVVP